MSRRLVALLALTLVLPFPALAGPGPDHAPIEEAALAGEGPRSVIVSTESPIDAGLAQALRDRGTVQATYTVIDGAQVRATPDALRELARLDGIERIDADEELAWHLGTSRPAVGITEALWQETERGSGSTIAVVDTGIDSTHPALQDRIQHGVTFAGGGETAETPASLDEDGHGTHVAGIAANTGDPSKLLDAENRRYAGVAPAAGLVALDISQSFTTSTAIDAFEWVHDNHEEHGITVVQNSWGRKEIGQAYDPGDPAIRASNTLVGEDDLVVVFSAANEGPEPQTLSLEAMNPNVLAVGAVDDTGEAASFSSRGPVELANGSKAPWVKPDVAAPGVQITSAAAGPLDGLYHEMSGTSQAAPHVSGVASLLQTRFPSLSAPAIHEIVRLSARDVGQQGPDPATGHGFLDAHAALRLASEATDGTLFTTTEAYEAQGTLAPMGAAGLDLPEDVGVQAGTVEGQIPVKDDARELAFEATWTHAGGVDALADVSVELADPSGASILLEGNGTSAQRTIEEPAAGTWTWQLEASGAGAAEYVVNGTVTLDREPVSPAGGGQLGTGQGVGEGLQELLTRAVDTYGVGLVGTALAIAVVGIAGLAKIAASRP